MDAEELVGKAREAWTSFKSGVELLCHVVMGTGVLALVVDSWLKLSGGKQREALGLVVSVVLGAAGAFFYIEEWLALAQAAVYGWGLLMGRAGRAYCARAAAVQLAVAGVWYALLTYGEPIVRGFGFPAPGLEDQLTTGAFCLFFIYHALVAPERLRICYLAATNPSSAAPFVVL